MLSWYTTKWNIFQKMIQIIAKFHEVPSQILNTNWLYNFNYNWTIWLKWFHINFFHSNKHKCVEKKHFVEYLYLKNYKNYVGGFCIRIHFICLSKCKMKLKNNCPKIYQKKTFSCLKQLFHSVFSRCVII
jgi:hypothetical protein